MVQADSLLYADDLSDLTVYQQVKSVTSTTTFTLMDVADGPKTLLQIQGSGWYWDDAGANYHGGYTITKDGTTSNARSVNANINSQDGAGDSITVNVVPPIRYDSSIKVDWTAAATGQQLTQNARTLGSGPHSMIVVKEGEPIYLMAKNLSEEQIESFNVPEGYEIVQDVTIEHNRPQTRGMWDGEKVVDHPYEKPFHETLDKLNAKARGIGVQKVLDEIEKAPTPYQNVFDGELPKEDPVEEAIQFWKEREEEKISKLSLSDIRSGK